MAAKKKKGTPPAPPPPKKKKRPSTKRRAKKKQAGSHGKKPQERLQEYAMLLMQNPTLSYKDLSTATGVPIGTIKSDLSRMRKKHPQTPQPPNGTQPRNHIASTPPKAPPATTTQPAQPLAHRQGFDWEGTHDKMGQIAAAVTMQLLGGVIKCKQCGFENQVPKDDIGGRMWMDTFGRMFASRMRAEHIMFFINQAGPTPEPQQISRADLLVALRQLDDGPTCVLCGQARPSQPRAIDAEYREVPNG